MIFAEVLSKYIDKPFKTGGMDSDGYDCLGLLVSICEDLKLNIPNRFMGFDSSNYFEIYQKSRRKAEKILVKYFMSFGKKVSPNDVVARDLILIWQDKKLLFPAMYIGNGNAITSAIRTGVTTFVIEEPEKIVIARRIE